MLSFSHSQHATSTPVIFPKDQQRSAQKGDSSHSSINKYLLDPSQPTRRHKPGNHDLGRQQQQQPVKRRHSKPKSICMNKCLEIALTIERRTKKNHDCMSRETCPCPPRSGVQAASIFSTPRHTTTQSGLGAQTPTPRPWQKDGVTEEQSASKWARSPLHARPNKAGLKS